MCNINDMKQRTQRWWIAEWELQMGWGGGEGVVTWVLEIPKPVLVNHVINSFLCKILGLLAWGMGLWAKITFSKMETKEDLVVVFI
jgi:hypothetical protein